MVSVATSAIQSGNRFLNPRLAAAKVRTNPGSRRVQDVPSLTISQEGRKLLSGLAEKGLSSLVDAGGVAEAMDALRVAVDDYGKRLAELDRSGRDPGKRVTEIREALKRLLERALRAVLMGDKRAAAAIAREAAGLAKDLSKALKEATAEAGNLDPGGMAAASAGEEALDPIGGFVVTKVVEPSASDRRGILAGEAEPTRVALRGLAAGTEFAAGFESPGQVEEGLLKEATTVLLLLRGVLSLARVVIKKKEAGGHIPEVDPSALAEYEMELARAELALGEALSTLQSRILG